MSKIPAEFWIYLGILILLLMLIIGMLIIDLTFPMGCPVDMLGNQPRWC